MTTGQIQAVKQDALPFSKMAGGGNDFVVIDNRSGRIADATELTRRICTPHLSVGADGVVLIEGSSLADFRMRYLNADGSVGEFCANGTRCAARFAVLGGVAPPRMSIETEAGVVGADVDTTGTVTLSLTSPSDFRAERPLRVGDRLIHGSSLMVGVPHYVIFLKDDLWSQDIVPLGRDERGVEAETLSCGSGVVASVSTSALFGRVKSPVSVLTRSGITLTVSFTQAGGELRDVHLRGDARLIYRSSLTAETLEGFDPDFVRNPSEKVLSAGS